MRGCFGLSARSTVRYRQIFRYGYGLFYPGEDDVTQAEPPKDVVGFDDVFPAGLRGGDEFDRVGGPAVLGGEYTTKIAGQRAEIHLMVRAGEQEGGLVVGLNFAGAVGMTDDVQSQRFQFGYWAMGYLAG